MLKDDLDLTIDIDIDIDVEREEKRNYNNQSNNDKNDKKMKNCSIEKMILSKPIDNFSFSYLLSFSFGVSDIAVESFCEFNSTVFK